MVPWILLAFGLACAVAGLISIAVLGIVVFLLFGWLSRKVVGHWYEATRRT